MLIGINGFFVAGEFALVAVNRSRVESRVEQGDARAARLLDRLRDLSFELSGAQLGITVTSLIIGAIAEDTLAELFAPVLDAVGITSTGVVLGVALVSATMLQMVLGELFPKNYAIARSYPAALRIGLPMAFVNNLMKPAVLFFNAAANWTVRRFGIEPRDELAGLRSLQELEMIVRASTEQGELGESEHSLLTRAISFVEREAADAMVSRVDVVGIETSATVDDVRRLAVETGHSRFPVFENDLDTIVGIVYAKDTFVVPPAERSKATAGSIAVPAHRIPESMRLDDVLVGLQAAGRSLAVVIDEYGGTAGIVTVEDIIEELLGEIEDEHDLSEPAAGDPDVVAGGLHRHEVEDVTDFEWPDGDYDTLNGYLTAELGRFPTVGDVVVDSGFRLEVVEVDNDLAERVAIRRVPEFEEAEAEDDAEPETDTGSDAEQDNEEES